MRNLTLLVYVIALCFSPSVMGEERMWHPGRKQAVTAQQAGMDPCSESGIYLGPDPQKRSPTTKNTLDVLVLVQPLSTR